MNLATVKYFDAEHSAEQLPEVFKNISIDNINGQEMLTSVFNDYKKLQKTSGVMPKKSSLDIKQIQGFLDNIFLLEILSEWCPNSCPFFYRVVGTGLRNIFGQEMSMKCLQDQEFKNTRSHLEKMFKDCEKAKEPMYFEGDIATTIDDVMKTSNHVRAQILLLPFSSDGKIVDHILGVVDC